MNRSATTDNVAERAGRLGRLAHLTARYRWPRHRQYDCCSDFLPMYPRGFTLIELMIVVVIIGILAGIAIPKFANTKEKAYIASMKSDLRNLVTAQEAYFADSTAYTDVTDCNRPPAPGSAAWCPSTGNTLDKLKAEHVPAILERLGQ